MLKGGTGRPEKCLSFRKYYSPGAHMPCKCNGCRFCNSFCSMLQNRHHQFQLDIGREDISAPTEELRCLGLLHLSAGGSSTCTMIGDESAADNRGFQVRLKASIRLALPTILLANLRFLDNKTIKTKSMENYAV